MSKSLPKVIRKDAVVLKSIVTDEVFPFHYEDIRPSIVGVRTW
jgi:hypothetical protein